MKDKSIFFNISFICAVVNIIFTILLITDTYPSFGFLYNFQLAILIGSPIVLGILGFISSIISLIKKNEILVIPLGFINFGYICIFIYTVVLPYYVYRMNFF